MAEQKVELRKLRDFGENINDTFLFIRQNLKPLIVSLLALCAVFMVAQAIFNGMYQSRSMSLIRDMMDGNRGSRRSPFSGIFSPEYFLMILCSILTFVSMNVALGSYLKYYANNHGMAPRIDDVWEIFKKYFLKVLVFSLPIYFMIILGVFFCLVPGIYLWVVLVPFPLVIILEEKNFGDAFYRCFELIKENFWPSLAIYIISYLIYAVCGLLIGGLISVIVGLLGYLTTSDASRSIAIASSFLNIFSFCFYIIYFISMALNYFNLVELKEGTGILGRIEGIGRVSGNPDQQEEQY